MFLKEIIEKKNKLDSFGALPEEFGNRLERWLKIERIHNSNAIRNNALSRSEISRILEQDPKVLLNSSRGYLEAINYAAAMNFAEQFIFDIPQGIPLQEILNIHELLLRGIDGNNAGKLRSVEMQILGSEVILPGPEKVVLLMDDFISWIFESHDHPVQVAVEAHLKILSIHPFLDANGRVARLIMNMILMQSGYPPAVILAQNRFAYISSIEKVQVSGDCADYHKIIFRAIEWSLDVYLEAFNAG